MKVLKWLVLALAVLMLVSYVFITSKHPIRSGELVLDGLSAPVTVTFDTYGVPHIVAENDEDMYRAFGYVHAQDRLFQMDLIRRLGKGRLAEWFGEDVIAADKLFRTLQIEKHTSRWMKNYMSSAPEKRIAAINAYLSGVNQFIAEGATPIEYNLIGADKEPMTTEDMAVVLGFTAFQFTIGVNQDVLVTALANQLSEAHINDLGIQWQEGSTLIPINNKQATKLTSELNKVIDLLAPGGLFLGSNGWIISGDKTEQGMPILVNDPHMSFAQPSVWYEAHLKSPESEIYGHHLALFPFALLGHNQDIAWGLTMFLNDDVDLYREKVNPDNPDQYWAIDEWRDFEKHTETIVVKDAEPVILNLRSTRHGPVINSAYEDFEGHENTLAEFDKDQILSMWWLFYHPDNNLIDPVYELSRSKTPDEAASAVSKIYSPGLNVMYADKNNNIAWWASARLIKRPEHVNPAMILDGASGKDDPLGFYDFSHNPQILNPEHGYLYSANNQPSDTGIGLVPGYYVGRDRAKRITELLSEERSWDVKAMQKMLLDNTSTSVIEFKDKILPHIDAAASEKSAELFEKLNKWPGNHKVTSIEPTIYYYFKKQLLTDIYADEMGEHYFEMFLAGFLRQKTYWKIMNSPDSVWWDNIHTKEIETTAEIINQAWNKTLDKIDILTQFEASKMQWQYHMRALHQHPFGLNESLAGIFNIGPLPAPGGNETINNIIFKLNSEPFIAQYGPSTRRVVDFSDLENSWGINPTGQSGVVTDKHYGDQATMYSIGEYRRQITSENQLSEHTASVLVFTPN